MRLGDFSRAARLYGFWRKLGHTRRESLGAAAGLLLAIRCTVLAVVAVSMLFGSPALAACNLQVVGDSLGVGVGQGFPAARVNARVGASSAEIVGKVGSCNWTVFSGGSNDVPWATPEKRFPEIQRALIANLQAARARSAGRWIWIVPNHPVAANAVRLVAGRYGDRVVTFTPGGDRVHPASYPALIKAVAPLLY